MNSNYENEWFLWVPNFLYFTLILTFLMTSVLQVRYAWCLCIKENDACIAIVIMNTTFLVQKAIVLNYKVSNENYILQTLV